MNFIWKDYCAEYENKVNSLFDDEAIRFTGCDEGFKAFYDYWIAELGMNCFFCKVIFHNGILVGVIAFARSQGGVFTIQEIIVAPEYRGKGYGTMILKEFFEHSEQIIGQAILVAKAVIYPDNIASQKLFVNANFVCVGTHPDGDALYYQYN